MTARKRGRPRATRPTVPVHLRISAAAFDHYARAAVADGTPLKMLFRRALERYARTLAKYRSQMS